MAPVHVPPVKLRGGAWVADLRHFGGSQYQALALPASASPVAVGMAVQQKIAELQVAASLRAPMLPGLERPGLTVRELALMYEESRDPDSYVRDYCKFVRAGIGHLAVESMAGKLGTAALRAWRDDLRDRRKWSPRTIRNALNMALAILAWGQDDGRELTGQLPKKPKHGPLPPPIFRTLPEADFRHLRAHLFDEAIHWGTLGRFCARVGCTVEDYIARRQLMLSFGFYTGAHPEDANTLRGEYLSVDVGRYERHNTKSSRVVGPDVFDMPEQLQIDCAEELRRRDLPRFPPDEIVTGPWPWRQSSRVLAAACVRLWPDGPARFADFRTLRRSCVWEYTVRGWRTHEIAAIVGHVDETMIRTVYRRCTQLGLVSETRKPWNLGTGPRGEPTRTGQILRFA